MIREKETKLKNQVIPIFYATNNRYAPYLSVSLESLVNNSSKERQYRVIVLSDDLNLENQKKLKALSKPNISIEFVSISDQIKRMIFDKGNRENKLRSDYFTFTIYFRLFISELFPNIDKAIYLDADSIVLADIAYLYDIDLKGNLIGAIWDYFVCHTPQIINYAEGSVGMGHNKYVNSGVLLMDLSKMRAMKFSQRFLNLLQRYHLRLIAPDQDYINAIARNRILYLGDEWNVQSTMPSSVKPKLIHYNTRGAS